MVAAARGFSSGRVRYRPADAQEGSLERALRGARGAGDDRRTPRRFPGLADRDRRGAADQEVSRADSIIERGADKLQELSRKAAASSGPAANLADVLAEDAAFLRQLKPSLIRARMRGELPIDRSPGDTPVAPAGPQIGDRPNPKTAREGEGDGPNPLVLVGVALAVGIVLAKVIDWRGHAHPRR